MIRDTLGFIKKNYLAISILSAFLFLLLTIVRIKLGIMIDGKLINPNYKWEFSGNVFSILFFVLSIFFLFYFIKINELFNRPKKAFILFFISFVFLFSVFSLDPKTDWKGIEGFYQTANYIEKNGVLDGISSYNVLSNGDLEFLLLVKENAKRYGLYELYKKELETDNGINVGRTDQHPPLMALYYVPFFWIQNSRYTMIIATILLSSINIALFYFLLSKLFDQENVFFMSLLLLTMPTYAIHSVAPWSEIIMFFPMIPAIYFFMKSKSNESAIFPFLAGFFLSIVFYVKFTAAIAAFAPFIIYLKDKEFKKIFFMMLGAIIPVLFFEMLGYHFLLTIVSMLTFQKLYYTGTVLKNPLVFYLFAPLGTFFNYGIIIWFLILFVLQKKRNFEGNMFLLNFLLFFIIFINGELGRYLIPALIFPMLLILKNNLMERKQLQGLLIAQLILIICFIIV